ncbi:hypothetical protein [Bacillus sp. S3]|nr:hypothetical protein [Bacillus sp. S3]
MGKVIDIRTIARPIVFEDKKAKLEERRKEIIEQHIALKEKALNLLKK